MLRENLKPIMIAVLSEGLTAVEIKKIVYTIIKKIKRNNKPIGV